MDPKSEGSNGWQFSERSYSHGDFVSTSEHVLTVVENLCANNMLPSDTHSGSSVDYSIWPLKSFMRRTHV